MKICILHNSSPGGARRLVDEIAIRLRETDDVTVCTWGDHPAPGPPGVDYIWCPGPPLRLRPPLHPFGNLARSYFGSARAARKVNRRGFDVALVLACQWGQAPEGLRHLRFPHLYFAQEGRRRTTEPGYLRRSDEAGLRHLPRRLGRISYDSLGAYLDRRAIMASAALATNSDHTARQLSAVYGVVAKVVDLGVDVQHFHPPASAQHHRVALLVGALDPSKGGELAIRALARVRPGLRPILRLIANRGDPEYGNRLVATGRSNGVAVEVVRELSDDALVGEYQSAALLLALADNEPFGLTVLEASACGTPTVAVAEAGYLRTVHPNLNGTLVTRDPDSVAGAVTDIVAGTVRFDTVAMAQWTSHQWGWDRCVATLRAELASLSGGGQNRHSPGTSAWLMEKARPVQ